MQQYSHKKILPLTIKQLKKAELDYRIRKSQVFQTTSYEFITIVARVLKVTTIQLKLTDETQILDVQFHLTALRKGADPLTGNYYKISFFPRRNPANSNTLDFFAFQIVGMMRVNPNEITLHLITYIKEKIDRQNLSLNLKSKEEITRVEIPVIESTLSISPEKNNGPKNKVSKKANGEYEISKYCKELGKQFDVDSIVSHFGQKYSAKEVQNVLEKLSQRGFIMDLGIVYEWASEE